MREKIEKLTYAKYTIKNKKVRKDGHVMFIEDIVKDLNRKSYLESRSSKLESDYTKLENRYCRVIEECIEKNDKIDELQKSIDMYKSQENHLMGRLKKSDSLVEKIKSIMDDWSNDRIGKDYQALVKIKRELLNG